MAEGRFRFPSATRWMPQAGTTAGAICGPISASVLSLLGEELVEVWAGDFEGVIHFVDEHEEFVVGKVAVGVALREFDYSFREGVAIFLEGQGFARKA